MALVWSDCLACKTLRARFAIILARMAMAWALGWLVVPFSICVSRTRAAASSATSDGGSAPVTAFCDGELIDFMFRNPLGLLQYWKNNEYEDDDGSQCDGQQGQQYP